MIILYPCFVFDSPYWYVIPRSVDVVVMAMAEAEEDDDFE
jgi:hypothetical protein